MNTARVAIAQINPCVGDLTGNAKQILSAAQHAHQIGADIVLMPELALTGYPPQDLLLRGQFVRQQQQVLNALCHDLAPLKGLHVVVGHVDKIGKIDALYNAASVLVEGRIIGTYHKHQLPNYGVFDEKRYFTAGDTPLIFSVKGIRFAVAICEDIWFEHVPRGVGAEGAQALLVLNASHYNMGKQAERIQVGTACARHSGCAVIYANLVGGEDELVFDGASFALDVHGHLRVRLPDFVTCIQAVEVDCHANIHPVLLRNETHIDGLEQSILVTRQSIPLAEQSIPVAGQSIPLAEQSIPVAGQSIPLVEQSIPVAGQSMPLAEQSMSVAGQPIPLAEQSMSVAGQPIPLAEQSMSVAGQSIPLAEQSIPIAGQSIPLAGHSILAPERPMLAQVWQALVLAVRDYFRKNGFRGAIIGLSGGIDSAVVLAIAVEALGAANVRAIMMPSRYTADISQQDACKLAQRLGVRYDTIAIHTAVEAFEAMLRPYFAGQAPNVAEENIQARVRGTLLMALSNKTGHLVLATGNKSELSTGYCTLYGDMVGGFAVIKDVPKTLVYALAEWYNQQDERIPTRILTRAPSAELRPDQKDQDSLPAYDLLDGIMEHYMGHNAPLAEIVAAGFPAETVAQVIRLNQHSEYKRQQAPIGPRITSRAFGRDWRYPITNGFQETF